MFYAFQGAEFDNVIAMWGTPCTYRQAVHNPKAYSLGGYTSRPDSDSPPVSASDEYIYPPSIPAIDTYVFRGGVGRTKSRWNDFGTWSQTGMMLLIPGRTLDNWASMVGSSNCYGSFGIGTVGCGWTDNPIWEKLSFGDRFNFPTARVRQNCKLIRGQLDTITVNTITSVVAVVDEDNVVYTEGIDFVIAADRKTVQWVLSPYRRGPADGKVYTIEHIGSFEVFVSTPDPQQLPGPERGGQKDYLRNPKRAMVGEWREKPISNAVAHWQD